ncbi:uncharacterized protein TNCV_3428421 [Trichonephila clavipes]|nr:uncharacterized protein TNCV_3428421 [Trichonephila clavipes]
MSPPKYSKDNTNQEEITSEKESSVCKGFPSEDSPTFSFSPSPYITYTHLPEKRWHWGANWFTCRNCGGGDRGRVAIYRPFGEVSLSLKRTVTCMVLKANNRRTTCPCHDEFRGPRSDYVRQVALATTTTQQI